jgi:hypothetical protein
LFQRLAVVGAAAHGCVQGEAVDARAEALNRRDGAAVGFVRLEPGLTGQVARDHAVHHLQHKRHRLGLCSQQQAQWDG